jgi:type IVB pilus formation R64 PilN family outer membrane protein
MRNHAFKGSLAVALTVVLSGCAAWYPETKADDADAESELQTLKDRLNEREQSMRAAGQFQVNQPWLVSEVVEESTKYPDLDKIKLQAGLYNQTLPQMSGRLTELSGVSIDLSSDLYQSSTGEINSAQNNAGRELQVELNPTQNVNTGNVMRLLGRASFGEAGEARENPLAQPFSISVDNESLTTAFNKIATRLGIHWKYNKNLNTATFYRLGRKNFQVFFPGLAQADIDVGQSGGSDNVIRQRSQFSMEGGTWEELSDAIQSLMTPFGRATIVKSTGNIVVTDTPEGVRNVEEYVESVNDIFGRQVYLQIRTATVSVENTNDFNITWNNILNTVNDGASSLAINSADVAASALPNALNVIRTANGASLALEMLAKETQNTEINEQSVTTLSNQPASLKVLTETGYISGISQQDGNVVGGTDNVVSDVNTDTVNIGFDATLIPRVVSSSTLQLQVALELSSNLTLVNFDSTIVQTPTRDRNSVVQRAWLKDGETWILAAFTSEKSVEEETGSGSSGFWGLGGGTSRSKERQVLLVMITPHIQRGVF